MTSGKFFKKSLGKIYKKCTIIILKSLQNLSIDSKVFPKPDQFIKSSSGYLAFSKIRISGNEIMPESTLISPFTKNSFNWFQSINQNYLLSDAFSPTFILCPQNLQFWFQSSPPVFWISDCMLKFMVVNRLVKVHSSNCLKELKLILVYIIKRNTGVNTLKINFFWWESRLKIFFYLSDNQPIKL